ncbi:MAG: aspartyl protease family protein [Leadbetterella sp.]
MKNEGIDGVSDVEKSSNNKISISSLTWESVPLIAIDYKPKSSFPFDVVLGWLIFENKIVEINYETQQIILHNSLPHISSEYSKQEFKLINGIHYIKCKLTVNDKESETWFDFDTGSNGELIIGKKFSDNYQLTSHLKKISTSKSKGSSGVEISNSNYILPKLKIGNYEMYQVPVSIPDLEIERSGIRENIGNNILKRFNAYIDFQNELIYLKPNRLYYSKM